MYARHAPWGSGAGTFEIARRVHRLDARNVSQPHSVPLQQLADAGLAGLALWIGLVLAGGLVCVRALRRLEGAERAAAGALVAAPAAFLLHSLVDYSWDFLAVTAPAALALGVLAAAGREPRVARTQPLLAVASVLLAVVALLSFAAPRLADRDVRASTRAVDAEDFPRALELAERARFFNPYSPEPIWALARRSQARGFERAAAEHYADAVELQPENPETWYRLGIFEYAVREPALRRLRVPEPRVGAGLRRRAVGAGRPARHHAGGVRKRRLLSGGRERGLRRPRPRALRRASAEEPGRTGGRPEGTTRAR